jgi:hypothetical protein
MNECIKINKQNIEYNAQIILGFIMQAFGLFETNFDVEYLTQHYLYTPLEDEKITIADLEKMLQNKRKTVAGTVFLYNPTHAPLGYNTESRLALQGYEFDGKLCELAESPMFYLFASALKANYKGKLVEIKYLFNINRPNIEPTPILEEFDADLEKLPTNLLTRYDRELNYLDIPNIRLSGKFVFFGCGHKHDRHHKSIIAYARALSAQVQKLGKEIAFMYDNNCDEAEAKEVAYFLSPMATGKFKDSHANGFKKAFQTNPPSILKLR